MSSSRKPSVYPPPLVVPSISAHKTTMIVLHGRGSTAEKFAQPLLEHPVTLSSKSPSTNTRSFQDCFPNTRFVFPTASLRRARAYNRSLIHQWFDMYPLNSHSPSYHQHIQIQGLRESVEHIHELLNEACDEVGSMNVILMGLSQGCATGLAAMMLWEGGRLGGFVGMCGWCALQEEMSKLIQEEQEDGDIFERGNDRAEEGEEKSGLEIIVEWLRDELEMEPTETSRIPLKNTLVFLGHGLEDEKVPYKLGQQAAELLVDIGVGVSWNVYKGLGHWYSGDMLRDILDFIKGLEGWESKALK